MLLCCSVVDGDRTGQDGSRGHTGQENEGEFTEGFAPRNSEKIKLIKEGDKNNTS